MTLDELEALEKAATPGPWEWSLTGLVEAEDGRIATIDSVADYRDKIDSNAALIAASRNMLPKLIAVARAAKRLSDNVNEFETVTDDCFLERLDAALAALEAGE